MKETAKKVETAVKTNGKAAAKKAKSPSSESESDSDDSDSDSDSSEDEKPVATKAAKAVNGAVKAAATKAKSLLDQEGRDDLALRIAVQPGGCAGLRYNLFFDDRALDGDLTAEFGGVKLTVDRMSAPYVEGASIDFVDTIEKQGFTIDNPHATGSCACGDSFN